ncbi:CoA transferase subunit A [Myxococcota bacterium]|nr:CoA transferase subunit A [Myxococcota bacterium]
MAKIITGIEAAAMVKPKDRIMIGGFLVVGAPTHLIDCMVKRGTEDLHLIGISTDYDQRGFGRLITSGQCRSVSLSYIGTHKLCMDLFTRGEMKIEFVPQGVLQERIRAAGAGLGGVFSPVGVGTQVAEGKETLVEDGKTYLLEKPMHADFAFIRAHKADKYGNLRYRGTAMNSNPPMAMAGKITICEVDEIVEPGEIAPEDVHTPGIFVNYLVKRPEGMEE